jgi:hypothetical protein
VDRRRAAQERRGRPDGRLQPGEDGRSGGGRGGTARAGADAAPAEVRYQVERGYRGAHVDHFFNFFEAIRGGPPVREDASFGLRAAAPALACNTSYFEDRIVRWDPDAMRLM